MLRELRDGHVNLKTSFDYGRNWSWKEDYPDNVNDNIINRNYLKNDYFITRALLNQWLRDSVGYIRYTSFGSPVSDADLDFVLERFKNAKGIIFDIRDNGGGSLMTVQRIMSRLIEKPIEGGYSLVKNGKGRNDYSPKIVYKLKPYKKKKPFLKPVMLLVNRGCYSASTFFAGFMSLLPQVTLIGDKTGGGGGLPISTDLPNGWQARFSGTVTCLPNGFNIENGVLPDIQVELSPKDEANGIDTIIERAIEEIKNKK
jgi:C-terminal processing protease CtpA/Prc